MSRKSNYLTNAAALLEEQQQKAAKVKAKGRQLLAKGRLEVVEEIDRLDGYLKKARSRLRALMAAGEDTWEEIGENLEGGWADIKGAIARLADMDESAGKAEVARTRPRKPVQRTNTSAKTGNRKPGKKKRAAAPAAGARKRA